MEHVDCGVRNVEKKDHRFTIRWSVPGYGGTRIRRHITVNVRDVERTSALLKQELDKWAEAHPSYPDNGYLLVTYAERVVEPDNSVLICYASVLDRVSAPYF